MTIKESSSLGQKRLQRAREVIRLEAATISNLGSCLGPSFVDAVELVLRCTGTVVVTGMGKAGLIGRKISATFASTGTPSNFLHAAEALHGDLGRIRSADLVLAVSNSGETAETKLVVPAARKIGAKVLVITGEPGSALARLADCVLDIGRVDEACPMGLAPTASTAALLAMGDALAMVVLGERNFSREDFAAYHPAGSLGRKLLKVHEVMRKGDELPLVSSGTPVREAAIVMGDTPGNPGSALIVDESGKLAGIFTDGDLRRMFKSDLSALDEPIDQHMGRSPKVVRPDNLVEKAQRLMKAHRVDQIAVVDDDQRPVGLLDVQDLLDVRI